MDPMFFDEACGWGASLNRAMDLLNRRKRDLLGLCPICLGLILVLAMWVLSVGSTVAGQTDAPFAIVYGGEHYDVAYAVQQTDDGGYVVLGHTVDTGDWVLRLDADGDIAWQKLFDGYYSSYGTTAIQQTDDGGFIVAGGAWSPLGAGREDVWVAKLDSGGCVVWQKMYGGGQNDSAATIRQTDDGGYVVAGETSSFGAGWQDAWLLKLDAEGNVIWERTYGETYQDGARAVRLTTDGGYIVAGYSTPGANSSQRAWVFRLDASGNVAWQKTYGRIGGYSAYDIQQAGDGGYVMAGETGDSGAGGDDAWVLKLDDGGDVVWQKTCGGKEHDIATAIQPTDDGGYLATGWTWSFGAGQSNAWVLKLDSDGNLCPGCSLGEPSAAVPADGLAEVSDSEATASNSSAVVANGYARVYDADLNPQPLCACSLSIQKCAEPAIRVPYHNTITYTVTLANHTSLDTSNAFLTDTLPAEVDFAHWVEQPAGAKVVEDRLTWSGTVTTGAAIDFTFVVSHVGDYQDIVVNTARYSHSTGTGSDDATFTVESQSTIYLPLIFKDYSRALPFATVYKGTGHSFACALQLTHEGGYIVAGEAWSSGTDDDVWLAKLNVDGSVAWQRTYGGAAPDSARAFVQMDDGSYMVAGYTESFGAGGRDVWLLKLDAAGNILWQRTFGGTGKDDAYAIQKTSDGGCVVAGGTDSPGALWYDAWVLKLNGDGSVAWQKTYGGESFEEGRAIQQTNDGGYIVVGRGYFPEGGGWDAWVFKLDGDGGMAWQKAYGGQLSDEASAIQKTGDGGYIMMGETGSYGSAGEFWVLKLDDAGDVTWQKTYGGGGMEIPYTIQQVDNGGYIVGGRTHSFGASSGGDAWVFKLDENGGVAWQKTFGGTVGGYQDSARAIRQTSDGGYVIAGETGSFGGAWVLRLNAQRDFCDGCFLGKDTDAVPADCDALSADTTATAADSTLMVLNSSATAEDADFAPDPICVCSPPICTRR